jgi:hypothetical protein
MFLVVVGLNFNRYNEKALLHGIIYLQRITDVRMGGVSTRTLRMFRRLCGNDSLRNMTVVTNMWSKQITVAEQNRERQLREDERFFKLFLDDHATMVRHDNTIESAHNIIRQICTNRPSALDIQRETVDERKTLPSTGAGIALRSALLEPAQGLQVLVDGLQERVRSARDGGDQAHAEELWTELWEMVPGLARLYNELKSLEALTGQNIDTMQMWSRMDSKAKIIAIFRRSYGAESKPELNAFWAALGDTTVLFREILDFFEECTLPLSLHDLLLRDAADLTPDASEKLDKWLSTYRKEIGAVRARVDSLIASKVDATNGKRGNWNRPKKERWWSGWGRKTQRGSDSHGR